MMTPVPSAPNAKSTVVIFSDGPSQVPVLSAVADMVGADDSLRVVGIGLDQGMPMTGGRYGLGLWAQFLTHAVRPFFFAAILRRHFQAFRARLQKENAALLILAETNVANKTHLMSAAAASLGVPVLIVPFTIPNVREYLNVLGVRRGHRVHWPWQRGFLRLYPKWGQKNLGGDALILRLPVIQAWQMELAGLAPERPWGPNDIDGAGTVALDGEAARIAHLALGIAPEKLAVVGGAIDDFLRVARQERQARREALYAELGLEAGRPLLLVSFPPNQIDPGAAPKAAYGRFVDLVKATMEALEEAKETFNVVIRPHPRLDAGVLAGGKDSRLAVSLRDTADLMPLCDLYMATSSATLRWALALGTPAIDYDVFGYDLGDYDDAAGVRRVENAATLTNLLAEAVRDLDNVFGGSEARREDSTRWGTIDGKAGERLRGLAHRLIEK